MKPLIVVTDGMDKSAFSLLKKVEQFDVHPESKVTPEQLEQLLPKASALVIRSATNVTADILEKAPNLRLVIRAGEGTDNIDKKSCALKSVKVANTPGANNNSAAEHAIALMMTVLRYTSHADASMKRGEWDKNSFTGNELTGKTVGVVGFGRIGQIVARRLSGFEPTVLFYDPFINDSELAYARKAANLEDLFANSDIISVHTPLMDATRGLIGEKLLGLMKPTAILINAARGGIVDEKALYNVLSAKKIRGAGVDVYEKEPTPKDNPLLTLPNIVATPHLGASTMEAQDRVGAMAVQQLQEFFINHKLLNEVKA
jgi:D-3-phosphoglycerate dehydrogenase